MHADSDVSVSPSQSGHNTLRGDDVIQKQSVIPIQTDGGTHKQANTRQHGRPDSLESPNRYSCLDCMTFFFLLKAARNSIDLKTGPLNVCYSKTDFSLSMQSQYCVNLSKYYHIDAPDYYSSLEDILSGFAQCA